MCLHPQSESPLGTFSHKNVISARLAASVFLHLCLPQLSPQPAGTGERRESWVSAGPAAAPQQGTPASSLLVAGDPPQARVSPHSSCSCGSWPSVLAGTQHPPTACPCRILLRQLQPSRPRAGQLQPQVDRGAMLPSQ